MFLFILESIGTQELIIIGIIALIVFGPRKLPEFAKKIAKTMAEFRKVTGEFKSTWEKEVEEDKQMLKTLVEAPEVEENSIKSITKVEDKQKLLAPAVKELTSEEIAKMFPNKEAKVEEILEAETLIEEESQLEPVTLSKRDWL